MSRKSSKKVHDLPRDETEMIDAEERAALLEQAGLLRDVREALQHGDHLTAVNRLEQIITLARDRDDLAAAARHYGNLALTYFRIGQPHKALDGFAEGLRCARAVDDRFTENGLLGNAGNVLRELGHFNQAIESLNAALSLAGEIGDQRGRGIWLSTLGLVYDDLGQPTQSLPLHQQAVDIARQLHDQPNLALRLGHLGNSLVAQGQMVQALPYFVESANIFGVLGRQQEQALRLGIIGNLYAHIGRAILPDPTALGHFSQALIYYQRTLNLAREMNDPLSEAELLRSIGGVLLDAGRGADAAPYLEAASLIFSQLGLTSKADQVAYLQARIPPRG